MSSRYAADPYDPTFFSLYFWSQVLLPPSVASMYEQLLKFEVLELDKHATVSWERILEIRHLKVSSTLLFLTVFDLSCLSVVQRTG